MCVSHAEKQSTHTRAQCPARGETCNQCGKQGHFQAVCRSPAKVGGVRMSTVSETERTPDPGNNVYLGAINDDSDSDDPLAIALTLDGKQVTLQIDTGADVTVISEMTWKAVGGPELSAPDRTLRGPDSSIIATLGKFCGTFARGTRQAVGEVYVAKKLTKSLLGRPTIQDLDLLKTIAAVDHNHPTPRERFPQCLGKFQGEYHIALREEAQPFALSTPRRVAVPLLKRVRQELDRMVKMGVISKVNQPTEWCAGMVKSNGRVRICVDLTRLNMSVKRERHPLPAVDQILAQLAGAKLFSKLDANSGFWQITLAPESSLFITPFGFNRLPFGISSAPEHFQRRMSEALTGLAGTVCMMDDILVYGETCDQRLWTVLEHLNDLGMTLNAEKCTFAQTSVKFLGHVIDSQGIKANPTKVEAIVKFTTPTSVGDIQDGEPAQQVFSQPCRPDTATTRAAGEGSVVGLGGQTATSLHDGQGDTHHKPGSRSLRSKPRNSTFSRCLVIRSWSRTAPEAGERRAAAGGLHIQVHEPHREKVRSN